MEGAPISAILLVFASAATGCSLFDGLPRGALKPVDCSDLPLAPDEMVAAIERSEAALTDDDLDRGEGQVAFQLSDDEGARWYLSPARDDADIRFRDDGSLGPRWALRVKLACSPEAAAFVIFAREDGTWAPLTPGDFRLVGVGIDIPSMEQGSDDDSFEGSTVTLTETTDERISGYLKGGGRSTIISYLTQQEIGPDFAIGAAAFRDVLVY